MTAAEIMATTTELWLNSPQGYPFSERIGHRDIGRLKSFLINTTGDEITQEWIRGMTHEELIQCYLDSNFQFLETWRPADVYDIEQSIQLNRGRQRHDI
jgi:hypothetical protein